MDFLTLGKPMYDPHAYEAAFFSAANTVTNKQAVSKISDSGARQYDLTFGSLTGPRLNLLGSMTLIFKMAENIKPMGTK